jgi:predicted transcriptional regulator
MTHFPDCSASLSGSIILLSVKPRFADLIVLGSKRVELRRVVPLRPVETIALYSSSPIQAIVAMVDVKEIIEASPSKLWRLSKEYGGGLTKTELENYFESKKTGFALILDNVRIFEKPIKPKRIIKEFSPPQSYKYLSAKEFQKLINLASKENPK